MDINLTTRDTLMATLPRGGKVVEVGVEQGKFAQTIYANNQPGELYLVDSWRHLPGTDWEAKDPAAKLDHDANYAKVQAFFASKPNVHIVRSLSKEAASQFADESLDIAYVDADHMNVRADIDAYWPKVKPGGWLCGHDYAMMDWITVKRDVDAYVKETGLPLLVTKEAWPSWAIQKPLKPRQPADLDVTLVVTVYPPYAALLDETLSALAKHWPDRPAVMVGRSTQTDLAARMLDDVQAATTEFVVVMHEDLCLCGDVQQEAFAECLAMMRQKKSLVSCSLTWEPSNTGVYHFAKTPYGEHFQELPVAWDYTINFQMRIWRRKLLIKILEQIPLGTTNVKLEPLATSIFRQNMPKHKAIAYAIPDPPKPSTFVDETSKAAWVVPYNNLIHAGKRIHHATDKMPTRCPIYINNRNRLTTTRKMVEYLQQVPDACPIIVDNASTYQPLLQWYNTNPCEVIRFSQNLGPQAPWRLLGKMMRGCAYYVVTDSDLDLTGIPTDLLLVLRSGVERYPNNIKAGLSLAIDDLPDDLDSTAIIRTWEQKHWCKRLDHQWFDAPVDTTFSMYRTGVGWTAVAPAIRADKPYTARHIPWYRKMDDEERFVESHCNTKWSTWAKWGEPNSARDKVIRAMQQESVLCPYP